MATDSSDRTAKQAHRKLLLPLMEELRRRTRRVSYIQLAKDIGIQDYLPSRILGGSVASPDWVTMTKLVIEAGMTPNQAAELAGLYKPTEGSSSDILSSDADPRLVEVVSTITDDKIPYELRESLLKSLVALASITREAVTPPREASPSRVRKRMQH